MIRVIDGKQVYVRPLRSTRVSPEKRMVSLSRGMEYISQSMAHASRTGVSVFQGWRGKMARVLALHILKHHVANQNAVLVAARAVADDALRKGTWAVPEDCESPLDCAALTIIDVRVERGEVRPSVRSDIRASTCPNCTKICPLNPMEGHRPGLATNEADLMNSSYLPHACAG